jgi:hypothetical protein
MHWIEALIGMVAIAFIAAGIRASLYVGRAARRFGDQLGKTLSVKDDSWAALNWGDHWELPLWNFWSEPAERLARLDPEFERLRRKAVGGTRVLFAVVGLFILGSAVAVVLAALY